MERNSPKEPSFSNSGISSIHHRSDVDSFLLDSRLDADKIIHDIGTLIAHDFNLNEPDTKALAEIEVVYHHHQQNHYYHHQQQEGGVYEEHHDDVRDHHLGDGHLGNDPIGNEGGVDEEHHDNVRDDQLGDDQLGEGDAHLRNTAPAALSYPVASSWSCSSAARGNSPQPFLSPGKFFGDRSEKMVSPNWKNSQSSSPSQQMHKHSFLQEQEEGDGYVSFGYNSFTPADGDGAAQTHTLTIPQPHNGFQEEDSFDLHRKNNPFYHEELACHALESPQQQASQNPQYQKILHHDQDKHPLFIPDDQHPHANDDQLHNPILFHAQNQHHNNVNSSFHSDSFIHENHHCTQPNASSQILDNYACDIHEQPDTTQDFGIHIKHYIENSGQDSLTRMQSQDFIAQGSSNGNHSIQQQLWSEKENECDNHDNEDDDNDHDIYQDHSQISSWQAQTHPVITYPISTDHNEKEKSQPHTYQRRLSEDDPDYSSETCLRDTLLIEPEILDQLNVDLFKNHQTGVSSIHFVDLHETGSQPRLEKEMLLSRSRDDSLPIPSQCASISLRDRAEGVVLPLAVRFYNASANTSFVFRLRIGNPLHSGSYINLFLFDEYFILEPLQFQTVTFTTAPSNSGQCSAAIDMIVAVFTPASPLVNHELSFQDLSDQANASVSRLQLMLSCNAIKPLLSIMTDFGERKPDNFDPIEINLGQHVVPTNNELHEQDVEFPKRSRKHDLSSFLTTDVDLANGQLIALKNCSKAPVLLCLRLDAPDDCRSFFTLSLQEPDCTMSSLKSNSETTPWWPALWKWEVCSTSHMIYVRMPPFEESIFAAAFSLQGQITQNASFFSAQDGALQGPLSQNLTPGRKSARITVSLSKCLTAEEAAMGMADNSLGLRDRFINLVANVLVPSSSSKKAFTVKKSRKKLRDRKHHNHDYVDNEKFQVQDPSHFKMAASQNNSLDHPFQDPRALGIINGFLQPSPPEPEIDNNSDSDISNLSFDDVSQILKGESTYETKAILNAEKADHKIDDIASDSLYRRRDSIQPNPLMIPRWLKDTGLIFSAVLKKDNRDQIKSRIKKDLVIQNCSNVRATVTTFFEIKNGVEAESILDKFQANPKFVELGPGERARLCVIFSYTEECNFRGIFGLEYKSESFKKDFGFPLVVEIQNHPTLKKCALAFNKTCLVIGPASTSSSSTHGNIAEETLQIKNTGTVSLSLDCKVRSDSKDKIIASLFEIIVEKGALYLEPAARATIKIRFCPKNVGVCKVILIFWDDLVGAVENFPITAFCGRAEVKLLSKSISIDEEKISGSNVVCHKVEVENIGDLCAYVVPRLENACGTHLDPEPGIVIKPGKVVTINASSIYLTDAPTPPELLLTWGTELIRRSMRAVSKKIEDETGALWNLLLEEESLDTISTRAFESQMWTKFRSKKDLSILEKCYRNQSSSIRIHSHYKNMRQLAVSEVPGSNNGMNQMDHWDLRPNSIYLDQKPGAYYFFLIENNSSEAIDFQISKNDYFECDPSSGRIEGYDDERILVRETQSFAGRKSLVSIHVGSSEKFLYLIQEETNRQDERDVALFRGSKMLSAIVPKEIKPVDHALSLKFMSFPRTPVGHFSSCFLVIENKHKDMAIEWYIELGSEEEKRSTEFMVPKRSGILHPRKQSFISIYFQPKKAGRRSCSYTIISSKGQIIHDFFDGYGVDVDKFFRGLESKAKMSEGQLRSRRGFLYAKEPFLDFRNAEATNVGHVEKKISLCNKGNEGHVVVISSPKLPFHIKYNSLRVGAQSFLRLPVMKMTGQGNTGNERGSKRNLAINIITVLCVKDLSTFEIVLIGAKD